MSAHALSKLQELGDFLLLLFLALGAAWQEVGTDLVRRPVRWRGRGVVQNEFSLTVGIRKVRVTLGADALRVLDGLGIVRRTASVSGGPTLAAR